MQLNKFETHRNITLCRKTSLVLRIIFLQLRPTTCICMVLFAIATVIYCPTSTLLYGQHQAANRIPHFLQFPPFAAAFALPFFICCPHESKEDTLRCLRQQFSCCFDVVRCILIKFRCTFITPPILLFKEDNCCSCVGR